MSNNPSLQGPTTGPETESIIVRNDEASVSIALGGPCVFAMDGTRDGKDVHLPSSSTAAKASNFFAGIAVRAIAAGKAGKVISRGVVQTCNITLATRAAATDTFATYAAIDIGDALIPNTVGNGMSRSGAGAASAVPAQCVAIGTVASGASQASTTSYTQLVSSTTIKAFLRAF